MRYRLASLTTLLACLAACTAAPETLHFNASKKDAAMDVPAITSAAGTGSASVTTTPEGCTIEKFTIPSPSMHRDINVGVMLPPAYKTDAAGRFPVLYALHGSHAPYASFLEMNPLRKFIVTHPMIIVAFDGDPAGFYIDATAKPQSLFATFFFKELIPYIDGTYRTRADGHSRAVTGFSMGGYGAFNYMLMHPEMFSSVSSLSGVFDAFGERTGHAMPQLAKLLGPYPENAAAYLQYGIYNRLATLLHDGTPLPPVYLHCGQDDWLLEQNRVLLGFLLDENRELHAEKKPEITVQYKESPGAHNWPFWRDASRAVAEFHWYYFTHANTNPKAPAKSPPAD